MEIYKNEESHQLSISNNKVAQIHDQRLQISLEILL